MKMTKLIFAPALLLAACGGEPENAATGDNDKDSAVAEIVYGPLKTQEEFRAETVYKTMAEVDAVADKSTVIRYVSSEYYQPFPTGILEAQNLHVLALTNMTDAELPADISKLKNLTNLVLYNASITKLPESLAECQNLKVVCLSGCKSLDIAQALDVLKKCPNIEYLDLGSMDITTMPAAIGEFKNLTEIYLGGNKFSTMPAEFYALQNLQDIHVGSSAEFDYNAFATAAKAFPQLTSLSFQYANLPGLPAVLNDYPALTTVHWREEWADKNGDQIIATTEKENKKFPKLHVTWDSMNGMAYDVY